MTRSLALNVLSVKTIQFLLISFVFFVLFTAAMPSARAATISNIQIQSILSILQAFGADQDTLTNVQNALQGGSSGSSGSTGSLRFVASPTHGSAPLLVHFQGAGSALTSGAFIGFGDGTHSSEGEVDVTHVYGTAGTYIATLHKDGAKGEELARRTITVSSMGSSAPTIHSFNAAPNPAQINQNIKLSWSSSGAFNCHVFRKTENGGVSTVENNAGTNGTVDTMLGQVGTYEYVLSCYAPDPGNGKGGPDTTKTLLVKAVETSPTISFAAVPTYIANGERAQLKWSVTDAIRCVLQYDDKEEAVKTSGTLTVTPAETTTYKLWCANDPGTGKDGPASSQSVTVSLSRPPAPTCRLVANKDRVEKGQKVTLTWVSSNANYASQKGGGYGPAQGSVTVEPKETTTYVKTVYGKGGSAKCSVEVNVVGSRPSGNSQVVQHSNEIATQVIAAVFSAPGNFLAQLFKPRPLSPREQAKLASSTPEKSRTGTSQGVEKNKFPGASVCGFLVRNLNRGASGDDVAALQEYLRSTGDLKDKLEKNFGPKTEEAIKKIQARMNIVNSGNASTTGYGAVGPRTRAILLAHCRALKERKENASTKPDATAQSTPAPTCVLAANDSEVASGENVTLTWTSTNATYASMPGGDKGPAQGSLDIAVTETTTYQKRVYGLGGEGTCQTTVVVTGDTSEPETKVVKETKLDQVFSSVGQSLAAAITAYFDFFGVKF